MTITQAHRGAFLDEQWLKNVGVTEAAMRHNGPVRVTDLAGRVIYSGTPSYGLPVLEKGQYYIVEQDGKTTIVRAQ